MLRLFVKLFFILFCINSTFAQGVHFSAVRQIPYFFNPAYTGFIEDDVRAGLIYRNQSPAFTKAYNTLGYGLDFSLLKQKTNNNSIIGVGVNGYYDQSGSLSFTDNAVMANFSYIQALDRKQKYYLSFGIQAGYSFRKIDMSKAVFEDGFSGDVFIPGVGNDISISNVRNRHVKLGAGLIAFFNFSDNIKMHFGGSANDLARQNLSFEENNNVIQKPRFAANFGLDVRIKQLNILPYFLTQIRMPQNEYVFGSVFKFTSDNNQFSFSDNTYSIGAGIGYRVLDAVILSAQAEYKKFAINISYDINISKLMRATRSAGAIEVSLIYSNSFLSPKSKGKRLDCPKFSF